MATERRSPAPSPVTPSRRPRPTPCGRVRRVYARSARNASCCPHQVGDARLGATFGVAPSCEVGPGAATLGHAVPDHRRGLVQDLCLLPVPADLDAQLGLLTPTGVVTVAARTAGGAQTGIEHVTPEGHVAAHDVAGPVPARRAAPGSCTRSPSRTRSGTSGTARRPGRRGRAADGDHVVVGEGRQESVEPAGGRRGVVVEEDDHVAGSCSTTEFGRRRDPAGACSARRSRRAAPPPPSRTARRCGRRSPGSEPCRPPVAAPRGQPRPGRPSGPTCSNR